MCLITVKEAGCELPLEQHLKNGETRNSDGIGIAYLKENEHLFTIKKDFKAFKDFYEFLTLNIKKEDFLIVHFRIATSGLKDEGNRHPFPVINDKEKIRAPNLSCKMVMAHNGVLSQFSPAKKIGLIDDKFSDSQKFVLEVLSSAPIKNNLDVRGVQILINDFLNGDRLVTVDSQKNVWYFGEWNREGDILYSNASYETPKYNFRRNHSTVKRYNNGQYDHWESEYFKKGTAPKLPFLKPELECENCKDKKKVKVVKTDGVEIELCKKCRRKFWKNKLCLDKIIDEKKIEEQIIENMLDKETTQETNEQCASCLMPILKTEGSHIISDGYKVCDKCAKELENCYEHILQ